MGAVKSCHIEYGQHRKYLFFGKTIFIAKVILKFTDDHPKKLIIIEGSTTEELQRNIDEKLPKIIDIHNIKCKINR